MTDIFISKVISDSIPHFKIGAITYHDIVIGDTPQMIKGRLHFFQETIQVDLASKALTDYEGILEWRQVLKALQMNPSEHPPSHEALYTRINKGKTLPLIHSALDLNTFFALQYVIPFGIHDLSRIKGKVTIQIGTNVDSYDGINGCLNNMNNKLISVDEEGAFGSPIVDSVRTKVTQNTTSALQLIYLRPSMKSFDAEQLIQAVGKMFTQIHGGDFNSKLVVKP